MSALWHSTRFHLTRYRCLRFIFFVARCYNNVPKQQPYGDRSFDIKDRTILNSSKGSDFTGSFGLGLQSSPRFFCTVRSTVGIFVSGFFSTSSERRLEYSSRRFFNVVWSTVYDRLNLARWRVDIFTVTYTFVLFNYPLGIGLKYVTSDLACKRKRLANILKIFLQTWNEGYLKLFSARWCLNVWERILILRSG